MRSFEIIQDCQWGSTGKGLFAGYLAGIHQPDVVAMAPSPNAGHTYTHSDGRQLIHRMLPLGILSSSLETIVLGPGSLVDMNILLQEIQHALEHGWLDPQVEIYIHHNAAVVEQRHILQEARGGTAPGSTRKGVGAAQMERIRRHPIQNNLIGNVDKGHELFDFVSLIDTPGLQQIYGDAHHIQIEGCQGYSLSLYHGSYPYVTCRDVTVYSLLADCGVPRFSDASMKAYGVFRTYPIRVANRPEAGEWSGPTYPDSIELTFEELGLKQELTTVTQLPRRIFTFSAQQAIEACVQNRIDIAFLNFAQYCPDWETLLDIWLRLEECTKVAYMGFGPAVEDILHVGAPQITHEHVREVYERTRAAD
jgi:adenylosuccinate synthase